MTQANGLAWFNLLKIIQGDISSILSESKDISWGIFTKLQRVFLMLKLCKVEEGGMTKEDAKLPGFLTQGPAQAPHCLYHTPAVGSMTRSLKHV